MTKILKALLIIATCLLPASSWAGRSHGQATLWDPITYFGTDLAIYFDSVDTSTVTTSAGLVTNWNSKVGTAAAVPLGTPGPAWSLTARNGVPGLTFSNAEIMSFPASGLPVSTAPSTIVVVGYAVNDTTTKYFASYGGGIANRDERSILSGGGSSDPVDTSTFGNDMVTAYIWGGNDRIVISDFLTPGVLRTSVDGIANDPSYPYNADFATTTAKGRLGTSVRNTTNKLNGVIQCYMVINRTLTQLEKDKLSGYLARRYNILARLPTNHPYKNIAPSIAATLSSDLLSSYNVVWSDFFPSLSLRTGIKYPGYITGKGTWADAGANYMTSDIGAADFGYGEFVRHTYNWQAIDPTFPPLGMIDITTNGLLIKGSPFYPAIRTSLGNSKFISGYVMSGYAAKIQPPYARRTFFTVTGGRYEWPAVWGLGDQSTGNATKIHNEVDDFEQFGVDWSTDTTAQHIHISTAGGAGGGEFRMGTPLWPGVPLETVIIYNNDFIYTFTNGVLVFKFPLPAGYDPTDYSHTIFNMAMGLGFEVYPGNFTGSITGTTLSVTHITGSPQPPVTIGQSVLGPGITAGTVVSAFGGTGTGFDGTYTVNNSQTVASETMQLNPVITSEAVLTVRSVEILAPASNTSGIFPPAPPVPLITWGSGFTGGVIPTGTANGTTVATLSGAVSYTLMDYNGATPSHLTISGSNVVTSGTLSAGTYQFYIQGLDAGGVPGIAPKATTNIIPTVEAFNPSDASVPAVLTNSNRTLTTATTALSGAARSAIAIPASSKNYAEYTLNVATADQLVVGIADASYHLDGLTLGNSFLYWVNDGIFGPSGTTPGTSLGTAVVGSVVAVATDLVNKRVWFRLDGGLWNASGTANPATNVGGFDISTWPNAYEFGQSWTQTDTVTANFGSAAFIGTPPTGFVGLP